MPSSAKVTLLLPVAYSLAQGPETDIRIVAASVLSLFSIGKPLLNISSNVWRISEKLPSCSLFDVVARVALCLEHPNFQVTEDI